MRRVAFKGYTLDEMMPEEEFKSDVDKHVKENWHLKTIYTIEDLKLIGKPYASGAILELRDGSLKELHNSFALPYKADVDKLSKQPWFGKVAVLKDGTIISLDTEKVVQKVDGSEFEDIKPLTKDYVCCFSHDWSAFDVIGAIDESYHAIMRNGLIVIRSDKYIRCEYDAEGKLVITPDRSSPITQEQLDKKYERVNVEHQFKETLESMKKLGISKEEIDQMTKYYKAYEDTERDIDD